MRAGEMSELDREPADAAAGAGDQHALAHDESAPLQRAQCRQAGHGQRRRLLEGDPLGQLGQVLRVNGDALRPCPGVDQAHHASAGRRTAPVGGRLHDLARQVPADHRAGLHQPPACTPRG